MNFKLRHYRIFGHYGIPARRDVLKPRRTIISDLYDFGDSWEHRLTVTGVRPGDPDVSHPRYLGGEYAVPPEDCGGLPGFYHALEAVADPDHESHAEVEEWFDHYDLNDIDELPIKCALARIANRRRAAQARVRKTSPR